MAKGSGPTKVSSSSSPKGLTRGRSLVNEGKTLGVSSQAVNLFIKAESFGNYKKAPAGFQKEFGDKASQTLMDIEKAAEVKARAEMEAVTSKINYSGGVSERAKYDAAREKFHNKMAKVRAYIDKLRGIQYKFNSSN